MPIPTVYVVSGGIDMTLKEWMEKFEVSQSDLAERVGVTVPMVSQVLAGDKRFGWDNANRIVKETSGRVTLDDLGWRVNAA
jgi:predicted transcriptional regulator